jgi:hypothetical protein
LCGAFAAAFLALGGSAHAATEFCAASLDHFKPIGVADGQPSSQYAYELFATKERTVDVTLVADTDHGWFSWKAGSIAMPSTTITTRERYIGGFVDTSAVDVQTVTIGLSSPLGVTFGQPVVVRHAWVASAGGALCLPPAFSVANMYDAKEDAKWVADPAPTPMPSPAPSAVVAATAADAPFPSPTCKEPFAQAKTTYGVSPEEPAAVAHAQNGPLHSYVAVALDAKSNLVDAWCLKRPAFRLQTAKRSSQRSILATKRANRIA